MSEIPQYTSEAEDNRIHNVDEAHEIAKKVDELESERANRIGALAIIGQANVERPLMGGLKYSVDHITNESQNDKSENISIQEARVQALANDFVHFATESAKKEQRFSDDEVWEKAKRHVSGGIARIDDDLDDIYKTGLTKEQQARRSDVDSTIENLRNRGTTRQPKQ